MRSPLLVVSSPVAARTTHVVEVAPSGELVFAPETLTALAGETVTFRIASTIHTVTQSVGVENPCVQSGFSSNLGDYGFDVVVNNTEPIYYNSLMLSQIFCAPHCSLGMVLIINPKHVTDHDSFAAAAQGIPPTKTPIQFPSPMIQSGYTGTISTPAVGAVSAASHRNIILGGIVGAFILLACALAIALVIRRRNRNRAIALGQPRALQPPSTGVPLRETNPLKMKDHAAEASDARIDEPVQGDSGTDARLQAALEELAALQTEAQELRQEDRAETLPEYESRDGDAQSHRVREAMCLSLQIL